MRREQRRPTSRMLLVTGIIGVVASAVGSLISIQSPSQSTLITVLTLAGGLAALGALIWQHVSRGPSVVTIEPDDWEPDGTTYRVTILARDHGRRNPVPTLYMRNPDGSHEAVLTDLHVHRNHDVDVFVGHRKSTQDTYEIRIS